MRTQLIFLVAVVLLTTAGTSHAALYTYGFTAVVANGTYAGETGTGTLTYDTDFLEDTIRAGSGGLSVSLDLFGQTFTHENDVAFIINGAPSVQFEDLTALDNPSMLDFAVAEGCFSGVDCGEDRVITPIDREGVLGFEGKALVLNAAENRYFWDVNVYEAEPVPAPAALYLLGSGLIGLIGVRRRK